MSLPKAPFDSSRFRLSPVQAGPPPPGGRRARGSKSRLFIAGPIDVEWLRRARVLGVSPLWLGLSLWHLRGLRRSDTVVLSNMALESWGIGADAKARALGALERAGLVAVERRVRRSPVVKLLHVANGGIGADKM